MPKRLLIDARHSEEMRVAIADQKQIFEFDFISAGTQQIKGNIYLAKITRVEPSLQAAFVEYGGGKQGFLPFSEIHPDYYQIPASDRQKLIDEAETEVEQEEEEREPRQGRGRGGRSRGRSRRPARGKKAGDAVDTEQAGAEVSADESAKSAAGEENVVAQEGQETTVPTPAPKKEAASDEKLVSEPVDAVAPAQAEQAAKATEGKAVFSGGEQSQVALGALAEQETSVEQTEAQSKAANGADDADKKEAIKATDNTTDNADATDATDSNEEGVETLEDEESEIKSKRKRRVPFHKRYKIQEVVKRGQVVLVQVIKEERGNKGVSLTTYLSLAGRYCVLMPNSPRDGGVSRKISDATTRRRLKELMTELGLSNGMSVIIRTAGIDRPKTDIRRDFDYLVKLWNGIREETLSSTAPAMVYEENNLIKRAVRDLYTTDIDEVLVEGDAGFAETKDMMKMLLPSNAPRVKQHTAKMPLFHAYRIEDQLQSMFDPVVKLKSGGYLVINPTEALISIDVNSGRSTGERNIEETATKTNLEAAKEISRQLRLRDLAGLIVVDYIDMMDSRNRRQVERVMKDSLRADRAKIQVGRISPFGLLEMSRQRLRPSISESINVSCPNCDGRGLVRSSDSLALQIIRDLEKEAASGSWYELNVIAPRAVALHLLNASRADIAALEAQYHVMVHIAMGVDGAAFEYNIHKTRKTREQKQEEVNTQRTNHSQSRTKPEDNADANQDEQPKPSRGRNRGGRGRRVESGAKPEENTPVPSDDTTISEASSHAKIDGKPVRRRGRPRKQDAAKNNTSTNAVSGDATQPSQSNPPKAANDDDGLPAANLPEFTRQKASEKERKVTSIEDRPPVVAQTDFPTQTTSRPKGTPAKKGWWQQMIELD